MVVGRRGSLPSLNSIGRALDEIAQDPVASEFGM